MRELCIGGLAMSTQFRIPVENYIIEALKAYKVTTSISIQSFLESEITGLYRNKSFINILGASEQVIPYLHHLQMAKEFWSDYQTQACCLS